MTVSDIYFDTSVELCKYVRVSFAPHRGYNISTPEPPEVITFEAVIKHFIIDKLQLWRDNIQWKLNINQVLRNVIECNNIIMRR